MVNVLKFHHFSLTFLKEIIGFRVWNQQNTCQNSKQEQMQSDLGLGCLSRSFWHSTSVQNLRKIIL